MKPFKETKIVACFMAHNEDDYIEMLLEDLSKYTKEFYVNLNSPTEKVERVIKQSKNIVKLLETTNGRRWNQGVQRDNTIRLLDDVKPDIVLFPDLDEKYPKNLIEQLKTFWEDEKAKTFWFRLLYLWDDENHFRNDGLYKSIHHVRAYKWEPNIIYQPKYAGFACPTSHIFLPKETRFNSNSPTLHYGYMKMEDRAKKYARNENDYINNEVFRNKIDGNKLILEVPKELL